MHTHTWTSAWLFFPWAVLDWYAELGREMLRKRRPTNDVLCLIRQVGGWAGGGARGGSSQTSLSASLFLPNSSLSEGGETDQLQENLVVIRILLESPCCSCCLFTEILLFRDSIYR